MVVWLALMFLFKNEGTLVFIETDKCEYLCVFYTYVIYFIWVWEQCVWILVSIGFLLILSINQCLFLIVYLRLDWWRVYF